MNIESKKYTKNLVLLGRRYSARIPSRPAHESMTDIERVELSGLLFHEDINSKPQDIGDMLLDICQPEGFHIADLIAAFCYNENPDTAEKMTDQIKRLLVNYYQDRMQDVIDAIREDIANHNLSSYKDTMTGEILWERRI